MACHRTALMVSPRRCTAIPRRTAMRTTSIAYSIRSCPSSVLTRLLIATMTRCIRPLLADGSGPSSADKEKQKAEGRTDAALAVCLLPFVFIVLPSAARDVLSSGLRRDGRNDRVEDVGDLVAGGRHRDDAAECDECDEHRVFDQVLSGFFANDCADAADEGHVRVSPRVRDAH